jgi:hypothetical protein
MLTEHGMEKSFMNKRKKRVNNMPQFAVFINDKVSNVIMADSLEYAIEHTGLDCVEVTNSTGFAYIGGDLLNGKFRPVKPSDDFEWDIDLNAWIQSTPI